MPVGFWVIMYAVLGIVAWILWLGQGICFAISSEKLIARARTQIFRAILHQDIEFFDEKPHAAGALAALISSGTDDLAAFSGPVIGSILTFLVTIVIGVIFSSISGWKLALVCSCAIPIIAACGWLRLRILVALDNKMRKANEDAASYASEMISAVQTVAILGLEPKVVNEYQQVLQRLAAKSVRPILLVSGLYAFAHSFTFLAAALTFWYGGKLIVEEGYTVSQVLICFTALISGAQIAGAVFSYAPDMSKAIHASQNLQRIFDRRPHIDTRRSSGKVPAMFTGRIEFEVVSFYYPTRPSHLVLDRLSLTILPGQYIALVGASGCGKSTIIALLERFFDPSCGRILVDGEDISNIDLNEYRKWMSLVSQEPVLYQGTIRENLIFGSTRDITEQDIIQACKEANIYDFISSLP
jgi:ATP-binding cassette subfamily B (MDR/TAP) protein 1